MAIPTPERLDEIRLINKYGTYRDHVVIGDLLAVIDALTTERDALIAQNPPVFDNTPASTAALVQHEDPDAELGALVRRMPEGWQLHRSASGRWYVTGPEGSGVFTHLCDTPEEALRAAYAKKGDSND